MKFKLQLLIILLLAMGNAQSQSAVTQTTKPRDTIVLKGHAYAILDYERLFVEGKIILTDKYLYFTPTHNSAFVKTLQISLDSIDKIAFKGIFTSLNIFLRQTLVETKKHETYAFRVIGFADRTKIFYKKLKRTLKNKNLPFSDKVTGSNSTLRWQDISTTSLSVPNIGLYKFSRLSVAGHVERALDSILFNPTEFQQYIRRIAISISDIDKLKFSGNKLTIKLHTGIKYKFKSTNQDELLNDIMYSANPQGNIAPQLKTAPVMNTVHTQMDSLQQKKSEYRSVYDTLSRYYNKQKLTFNIGSGNGDIDVILASIFGTHSAYYKQNVIPFVNFSVDYGITRKSTLGIATSFQQVTFVPQLSSPAYSNGRVSLLTISARYTHCICSWRFLYYGFQAGVASWMPSYNSNTFYDIPKPQPLVQLDLNLFLGVHIHVTKNILIHMELAFNVPVTYTDFGLNYKIDTRRKKNTN